jgi:hypothetical protein
MAPGAASVWGDATGAPTHKARLCAACRDAVVYMQQLRLPSTRPPQKRAHKQCPHQVVASTLWPTSCVRIDTQQLARSYHRPGALARTRPMRTTLGPRHAAACTDARTPCTERGHATRSRQQCLNCLAGTGSEGSRTTCTHTPTLAPSYSCATCATACGGLQSRPHACELLQLSTSAPLHCVLPQRDGPKDALRRCMRRRTC